MSRMLATNFSSVGAWFLIIWGIILVLKPNLFVSDFWKRFDRLQRRLSPEAYLTYTRRAGIIFIVGGFVWLFV